MTTSPAFLREIADQADLARQEMAAAMACGDESAAQAAAGRLADLDELASRATDASLLADPSWP